MATVTGNEYEHIDFTHNNITTRHPLKDATARSMVGDIVRISDTDPQLANNKIWIKETPEASVQVPTYEEFDLVKQYSEPNRNLINPNTATDGRSDYIPIVPGTTYVLKHLDLGGPGTGDFGFSLSTYDSNKENIQIGYAFLPAGSIETRLSFSSGRAYLRISVSSAPEGVDKTDLSRVYLGEGQIFVPYHYSVPDEIEAAKGEKADIASVEKIQNALSASTTGSGMDGMYVEQGSLSGSNGSEVDSQIRIRTGYFKFASLPATVTASSGYLIAYRTYYENFEYSSAGDMASSLSFSELSAERYIRLIVKKSDESVIRPEDFSSAISSGLEGAKSVIQSRKLVQRIEEAETSISDRVSDSDFRYITGNSRIPITGYGQWIDLSGSTANVEDIRTSSTFNYSLVPCDPGDQFTINGQGGTSPKAYAFIAENGDILEKATQNTVRNKFVEAPANTVYLVVHYGASSDQVSYFGRRIADRVAALESNSVDAGTISDITDDAEYITGCKRIEITGRGHYIDLSGSIADITDIKTSALFNYSIVPCSAGQYFTINADSATYPKAYAFINSNGLILEKSTQTAVRNKVVQAPENSTYLIINYAVAANKNSYYGNVLNLRMADAENRLTLLEKNHQDFNLNINLSGLHDMCWEYQNWVFPQCVSCSRYRDQLFFGFVTGDTPRNYTGVASYDFDTKEVQKTILKRNKVKDDHNLTAVRVLSTGKVLCAYSDGHNDGYNVFVRISDEQESIDRFGDAIQVSFAYKTSYVQIFEYSDKLYLFTREVVNASSNEWRWAYKISEDFGVTWGEEYSLITANTQYYIQLTETNTPGVLMLCCYSNPAYSDTDIRVGYLHLDTLQLYQADDATLIGTTAIPFTDIDIAVSPSSGKRLRLYNGLSTDVGDVKFLYCEFTYNASSTDGVYKVYDNGISYEISNAGSNLLTPGIQLGTAWIDSETIAVSRSSDGSDYLEIYSYDSQAGTVSLLKQIDTFNQSNGVRIARPMVDQNGRAMVYWKGYFNPSTYTDFFTDGRICELDEL